MVYRKEAGSSLHSDPDSHFLDKRTFVLSDVLSRLLHAWSELERPCIAICTATTAIAARVLYQPPGTMMIRCRLSLPALVLALSSVAYSTNEEHKSIDQIIMEAAPNVEMFDMLHMTPEGDVMVMVELDILMSLKQYMELKEDPEVTRSKRKAVSSTDRRWRDSTVYFELSNDLREYFPITGREQKCANSSTTDKIIFRDGNGCFSQLGKVGGGQAIGLSNGCFQKGVVVHEIGHAIGWIHEQARPDRDSYIRVNYNRIPQSWHPQFDKFDSRVINLHGVEYDYRSVMHYSGSSLGEKAIETLDPAFQNVIGQRKGLSFRDIKLANIMYECAQRKGCMTTDCSSFGKQAFKDKNCNCVCPGNDTHPAVRCVEPITTTRSPATTTKPATTTRTTEKPEPMACVDLRPDCQQLVTQDECRMSPSRMLMYCKKACNFCDKDDSRLCMDFDPSCPILAQSNFCENSKFAYFMSMKCKKSCKMCATTDPCQMQKDLGLDLNSGNRLSAFSELFFIILTLIIASRHFS